MSRHALTIAALLATAAVAASAQATPPLPLGSGAGVHSPNSPFAPLPARADVVPWSVLTDVKTRIDKKRALPDFQPAQVGLDGKTQRIQGFMMPLEAGERHRHFLLSSVPLSCGFCLPGGPESIVEVRTRTPLAYSMEPVTVEGRFSILRDDPFGLFYRLTEGAEVK